MWQLGGKCCPFFVWFSNIFKFLQTHFSTPIRIRIWNKLPYRVQFVMDYQKMPFRSTNFITLHGLLSVVHCSHIFPPQQPNMWKKLTWARARRAVRPTIAVIFFFQFSTPCSAVWENYAPADMINSWVDRSSWGSAYTHFIYCICVDVHFFSFRSLNE